MTDISSPDQTPAGDPAVAPDASGSSNYAAPAPYVAPPGQAVPVQQAGQPYPGNAQGQYSLQHSQPGYGLPGQHAPQGYGQPQVAPKNPGLALLASFFFPGLGTLMNGQAGKGIAIFACYVISWLFSFILIGIPFLFGFWIWGLVDAYQGAKKWNAAHGVIS